MQGGMESARMKQQLQLEAAAKVRADEVRRWGERVKFNIITNLLSWLERHLYWNRNEEWIRSKMKEGIDLCYLHLFFLIISGRACTHTSAYNYLSLQPIPHTHLKA